MTDRPAGRRRRVLVAGVPDDLAARAAEAVAPDSMILMRAVPSPEAVRALDPAPDLILVGATAGDPVVLTLLESLKSDPARRAVPVLVGADVWPPGLLRAHYRVHANACLEWPEPASMRTWFAAVLHFWFHGEALLAPRGGR